MDLATISNVAVRMGSMVPVVRFLLVHAVSPTTAGTMALAMTVLVSAGIRTLDLTVQTVDVFLSVKTMPPVIMATAAVSSVTVAGAVRMKF
jgi:hypothetical protein